MKKKLSLVDGAKRSEHTNRGTPTMADAECSTSSNDTDAVKEVKLPEKGPYVLVNDSLRRVPNDEGARLQLALVSGNKNPSEKEIEVEKDKLQKIGYLIASLARSKLNALFVKLAKQKGITHNGKLIEHHATLTTLFRKHPTYNLCRDIYDIIVIQLENNPSYTNDFMKEIKRELRITLKDSDGADMEVDYNEERSRRSCAIYKLIQKSALPTVRRPFTGERTMVKICIQADQNSPFKEGAVQSKAIWCNQRIKGWETLCKMDPDPTTADIYEKGTGLQRPQGAPPPSNPTWSKNLHQGIATSAETEARTSVQETICGERTMPRGFLRETFRAHQKEAETKPSFIYRGKEGNPSRKSELSKLYGAGDATSALTEPCLHENVSTQSMPAVLTPSVSQEACSAQRQGTLLGTRNTDDDRGIRSAPAALAPARLSLPESSEQICRPPPQVALTNSHVPDNEDITDNTDHRPPTVSKVRTQCTSCGIRALGLTPFFDDS